MSKMPKPRESTDGLPLLLMACSLVPMAITLDEIVEETAQLPEDVAAELVERILVKRHGGIESGVEAAWKAETSRRVAEITSGQVVGVPLEVSLARASRVLREWGSSSIPPLMRSFPRSGLLCGHRRPVGAALLP